MQLRGIGGAPAAGAAENGDGIFRGFPDYSGGVSRATSKRLKAQAMKGMRELLSR